jgi:hypothetical protein
VIFTPDNYNDIVRYYQRTYVKFKEMGDILYYISKVTPECVYGYSEDETPFELYLNSQYPFEVSYVLPNKAYYQLGTRAVLLQRVPAKQYQRGIGPGNVGLRGLTHTGEFMNLGVGFDTLKPFVTKQAYMPFHLAIKNKEKYISYALNSRIAYATRLRKLYVDDVAVGEVVHKEKTVLLHRPIFRAEIEALLHNTTFKVIV